MTVEKMIAAHRAFRELLALRLPYGKVRQLRRLAAWLEDEMALYCAEERQTAARCGATIEETGELLFPDDTAREKYLCRLREVRSTPVDGWSPVSLTEKELEGQKITLRGMMDLEGFVEFGGDDRDAV